MSKFGELTDLHIPVLVNFFASWDQASRGMDPVLRDIAAAVGDRGKILKVDVDKNAELAGLLRVKILPTLMIYKDSEMKWRQSGPHDANSLISLMQQYF